MKTTIMRPRAAAVTPEQGSRMPAPVVAARTVAPVVAARTDAPVVPAAFGPAPRVLDGAMGTPQATGWGITSFSGVTPGNHLFMDVVDVPRGRPPV